MIKRYGNPRLRDQRYKLRPGAYAILPRGHDLLLTFQGAPFNEFQLPGGGIDPGETPVQALHREVMEETGWRIATPRRLGAHRRFVWMPDYDIYAEKLCHIFLAYPVRAHGKPTEEGHDAVWMNASTAIPQLSNAGDQAFLARYHQSQTAIGA